MKTRVKSLKHLLIGDVHLSHHSRVLECDRCTLSELDVMRRAMFVGMVNAVKPLDCENRIHLYSNLKYQLFKTAFKLDTDHTMPDSMN